MYICPNSWLYCPAAERIDAADSLRAWWCCSLPSGGGGSVPWLLELQLLRGGILRVFAAAAEAFAVRAAAVCAARRALASALHWIMPQASLRADLRSASSMKALLLEFAAGYAGVRKDTPCAGTMKNGCGDLYTARQARRRRERGEQW